MQVYIFENNQAVNHQPLSFTRCLPDIRNGYFTGIERLALILKSNQLNVLVREEYAELEQARHPGYSINPKQVHQGIWLLGNVVWNEDIVQQIKSDGESLYFDGEVLVAANLSAESGQRLLDSRGYFTSLDLPGVSKRPLSVNHSSYLWDMLSNISDSIQTDFTLLRKKDNFSAIQISPTYDCINPNQILTGSDVQLNPRIILDASEGAIIIGDKAVVNSFSYIKGPVVIGDKSIIQPFAQITGCIIGPGCKIGGEVSRSIIQANSNKVHYGYLGDSFVGEWVNFGAGTTNSNLKNNYSPIRIEVNGESIDTQRIYMGVLIGDHCKTGIGTRFNTGSIVGTGSSLVSNDLLPKSIPPFSWVVPGQQTAIQFDKFIKTAGIAMSRRNQSLSSIEEKFYQNLYKLIHK